MLTSKKPDWVYQAGIFSFLAFSFFSAIFCGQTRVNNLFHISALLLAMLLLTRPQQRQRLFANTAAMTGMALVLLFLLYYSISALWGADPGDMASTLTHSGYILFYLTWLIFLLDGAWRYRLLAAIVAGITLLCLYLAAFDYPTIYHLRTTTAVNPGPDNVIDLAGYAAIGILLSLMIFRDTRRKAALLVIAPLFAFMVLTQSRGPLIALAIALAVTTPYVHLSRNTLFAAAAAMLAVAAAVVFSATGEMLLTRFGELYQQSFVRMSIWRHSLELISQAPFLGYGVDKQLNFLNYTGELNHTTHSLYLGALLKGGLVGFLLFAALLIYGARLALRHRRNGRRLEAALYLFMLVFYCSQGMFVIANPAEFWILFWLPLALVMSQPAGDAVAISLPGGATPRSPYRIPGSR